MGDVLMAITYEFNMVVEYMHTCVRKHSASSSLRFSSGAAKCNDRNQPFYNFHPTKKKEGRR